MLENMIDSSEGILSKLSKHYTQETVKGIVPLLFSINVIGNPVGLFKNISTGMKDLVEKPLEGFEKGPLEGGYGMVKGASSLVRNTASGAFNSLGKITDSVSTGLSALTMDQEYMQYRERLKMKKAKDVLEGVEQGAKSMLSGFEKGLTGIVLKPAEGAKKEGVAGFLKGTFQGLTGLVVKPVAGVLDFATKTTEGLKNTTSTKTINEDLTRPPRAFYGADKQYRIYSEGDSNMNLVMQKLKEGKYARNHYIEALVISPDPRTPTSNYILLISCENILGLSYYERHLLWEINTSNIVDVVANTSDKFAIVLKEPTKQVPDRHKVIITRNEKLTVHLVATIKSLLEDLQQC
eukprot:TRINITY_DN3060_c0_g2_i1.p1 TRINITY_DN3060_c0_g2~~TRINITY_DN3060_c0_g2_i1.p1  ORF type:complete len:350 (+),score=59.12 TRINITY_DN3060_c0_g2_i1:168-1217(+)